MLGHQTNFNTLKMIIIIQGMSPDHSEMKFEIS